MKGCQLNSLTHGSVRPFQAFIDLIVILIVHTWACKAHNSSQCQNYFPCRTMCRHILSRILVNLASHLLKSFCVKELFADGLARLENTGRLICITEFKQCFMFRRESVNKWPGIVRIALSVVYKMSVSLEIMD